MPIKMQLSVLVTAAFFAFYILLLFLGDIRLRQRHTNHSCRYFILRIFVALLFFGSDILLLVESKRILAAFYGLQGLSWLLSFIIQVMIGSRSVPGNFIWNNFQDNSFQDGPFPWVLSAFVLAVLGFTCPAFAFILLGYHSDLGLMLVAAGSVLVYGFLGSLTIGQLDRSGILGRQFKNALGPLCVSGITVIAMPVSVLFLYWRDVAVFLLAQTILSSAVTTSWIILMLCKLEDSNSDIDQWHIEG